jgi:20S proteasome alpha/beta subunit
MMHSRHDKLRNPIGTTNRLPVLKSKLWVFYLTLTVLGTVGGSSSSDSSSVFAHPFSLDENGINIMDPEITRNSRPRARIVEWQLSDDNALLLSRRRRHKWQDDDDELDAFPSLSQDYTSDKEGGMTENSNDHSSKGQSPHSLSLHLEGRPRVPSSFGSRQTTGFPTTGTPISIDGNNDETTTTTTTTTNLSKTRPSKNKFKKTGTTIAGCCVDNHVLLAADTRATEATMVADKMCQKLHQLATNSWCAGAGTSADLDHLTKQCLYSLALQRLQEASIGNENAPSSSSSSSSGGGVLSVEDDPILLLHPVSTEALCNFFQDALYDAGGNVGANLILGAVWKGQAQLRAIHPHGSMDVDLPFAALGSGGLAAMGVMEQGFRNDLTLEEGIDLLQRSIVAGIRNDLGSGSQVDLCIIRPDGSSHYQRCVVPEEKLDEGFVVVEKPSTTPNSVPAAEQLGVNGFGNLPFAVMSKKTVLSNDIEKERLSSWNELLGLN